jgi:hypothetical protein
LSQTIKKDSLKCAVKTIDLLGEKDSGEPLLCLYAGLGKVLKVLSLDVDKKEYSLQDSYFFQNENIIQSRFVNKHAIASQLLKKKYISIFDTNKEKSTKIFKLFSEGSGSKKTPGSKGKGFVDCFDASPNRSLLAATSGNLLGLVDSRTQTCAFQKNLMNRVTQLKFQGDSSLVFQCSSGLFKLDLRYYTNY